MLGDMKTADELVPVLSTLVPELAPLLNEYLKATTPPAKKFAAIYAWLKFPGLEPIVDIGVGRRARIAPDRIALAQERREIARDGPSA